MLFANLQAHTIHLTTRHGIDPEWEQGECQLVAETASGEAYSSLRIFSSTREGMDALRAVQANGDSIAWLKNSDIHP